MPHKVNPIDFENAEGNFYMANAMFQALARSLPISRMQRDLSDSTRLRNLGSAMGYSHVAYRSLLRGIGKIDVNEAKLHEELDNNWAVLTEAVQTVMRSHNVPNAYKVIKETTRGKELTREGYLELVLSLRGLIPDEAVLDLVGLTPWKYVGLATDLATK